MNKEGSLDNNNISMENDVFPIIDDLKQKFKLKL